MANAGVVLEDVLNDTLLLGSLAASIFVKAPGSQNLAANLIKAAATLIQVIESQLPAPAAPAPITTPATPAA